MPNPEDGDLDHDNTGSSADTAPTDLNDTQAATTQSPTVTFTGRTRRQNAINFGKVLTLGGLGLVLVRVRSMVYSLAPSGSWVSEGFSGHRVQPPFPNGSGVYDFNGRSFDIKGLGETQVGITADGKAVIVPGSDGRSEWCHLVKGKDGEPSKLTRIQMELEKDTETAGSDGQPAHPSTARTPAFVVVTLLKEAENATKESTSGQIFEMTEFNEREIGTLLDEHPDRPVGPGSRMTIDMQDPEKLEGDTVPTEFPHLIDGLKSLVTLNITELGDEATLRNSELCQNDTVPGTEDESASDHHVEL